MMAGPHALQQTHELIARVEAALAQEHTAASVRASAPHSEDAHDWERPSKVRRTSNCERLCCCHSSIRRLSPRTITGGASQKARVADDDAVQAHERRIKFPVQRLHYPSLAEFRERVLLQECVCACS